MTDRERRSIDIGRLRDNPGTIVHLEQLLDAAGPHFEPDGWMWCSRCRHAYPVGDLRVTRAGPGWGYYDWTLECAVEGCPAGRAEWYPWHEQELPRALHPEYPEIPDAYARYWL